MIKVGYLTKKRDACHWLRVLNPMSLLNANGHQANDELLEQQLYCMKCRKGPYETQYTEAEVDKVCPDCSDVMMSKQDFVNWKSRIIKLVRDHDIICFQRPTHPAHVTMMRESKFAGKKVVQICDDDYINIPEFNTGYKYYTARRQVIIESLQESDAIDVTTPYLKNLYSRFCENVEILPNCLDLAMVDACMPIDGVKVYAGAGKEISWDKFSELRKGKRLVLWGGSPTHEKDLEVVIPAIRRLSRDENLLFAFVGYVHRAILEDVPAGRLFLFGLVSNTQYFPLYKKIAPDIGIAPVCEIPFNEGKCIVAGTQVVTEEGMFGIDELTEDRENGAFNNNVNGLVSTPVGYKEYNSFFYEQQQECFRVTTEWGYQIEGTSSHKVQTEDGKWKTIKSLTSEDRVKLSPYEWKVRNYQIVSYPLFYQKWYKHPEQWSESMAPAVMIEENWGRFIGYIVGDGSVFDNTVSIALSSDYQDIIKDVERLAKNIGVRSTVFEKKDARIKNADGSIKIGKGRDVKLIGKPLSRFLQHIGLVNKKGKKQFKVPDVIKQSPKKVIREFIRGLFEADGTVSQKSAHVEFCTKSEKLARDVQQLLLIFGIKSQLLNRETRLDGWSNGRVYWYIHLRSESARIFAQEIGFISNLKNERLRIRCSKRRSNHTYPLEWSDRVTSVVSTGKKDVYDITVPKTHHYTANGIVSHNSNLKSVEYQAIGVLPVVSDWVTYKNSTPAGIYAENTPRGWYNALSKAASMSDEDLKSRTIENRKFIEDNYDISTKWQLWVKFYEKVLAL